MREGVDLGVLARVTVDTAQAGEGVLAVDVHGTRAADALAARAAERQRRVDLVLDLDERIENLWGLSEMSVRFWGFEFVWYMGCEL